MLLTTLFAVILLVMGCAGVEPYEPRDHREEGPEHGLFSGERGEFVIFKRKQAGGD
jgi:hypothetical protein